MAIEIGRANDLALDKKRLVRMTVGAALILVAIVGVIRSIMWLTYRDEIDDPQFWKDKCVQPESLIPEDQFAKTSRFLTKEYRDHSANLLGGAVRIPTESFDDMAADPRTDKRFEVFSKLHAYLNESFPLASGTLEIVNSYGLLYTVKGKSNKLPTVFMAHQDVVPVEPETASEWTYDPFSGHYDGERVWGRGSQDTKSSLIAILESVESLLQQGWEPRRDVVLAFGFDEELDGSRGARHLSNAIRERYGPDNSIYMIVDEGEGIIEEYGSTFAAPAVSEKGYTDLLVTVHTPGGHSSMPPNHTGIGIASRLIVALEDFKASTNSIGLSKDDAIAEAFTCFAAHGKDISSADRKTFTDHNALVDYIAKNRELSQLVGTTQAVDVIWGGVKINALPEQVSFIANYRIGVHESVDFVTELTLNQAASVAANHTMGLVRNNRTIVEPTEFGYIEIVNGQSLEPAPVAPHTVENSPWRLISGTTRHVLEEHFGIDRVFMTPMLLGGNTDTVHYWGLSDSIFRFTVALPNSGANAHTVDEWISIDSHLATVAWYYEMLQFI